MLPNFPMRALLHRGWQGLRRRRLHLGQQWVAHREVARAFAPAHAPPILIYQMGKVGSSTVYRSLRATDRAAATLQLHFLSDDLARYRQATVEAGTNPPPQHFYLSHAVRRRLARQPGQPLSLISLVRDPVALMMSNLFENPQFAAEYVCSATGQVDGAKAMAYLEHALRYPSSFDYIYTWFDRELKTVFDIDVFASPFDTEVGYQTYERGAIRTLVIPLEHLSQLGPVAIGEFLHLAQPLALQASNVRAKADPHDPYYQVRSQIRLSLDLCQTIYSAPFVRHFYSPAMIQQFVARWSGGPAALESLET